MYVTVRLKTKEGDVFNIKVELPSDIKNYEPDTINDVVSDYLDDNLLEVQWFRVETGIA